MKREESEGNTCERMCVSREGKKVTLLKGKGTSKGKSEVRGSEGKY